MAKNIRVYLILILLSFMLIAQGQDFSFQHLDGSKLTNDGYYDFFYKDSDGFIWIGSLDGTSRFDGQTIKQIFTPNHSTTSDFYEDENKNLWFSRTNSLVKYHRNIDSLETFKLKNSKGDTVTHGYYIFHLSKSKIWLRIDNEITCFDIERQKQDFFSFSTQGMRFQTSCDTNSTLKNIYATPWNKQPGIEKLQINPKEKHSIFTLFEIGNDSVSPKVRHILKQDSIIWLCTAFGLLELEENNLHKANLYNLPNNLDIWNGTIVNDSLLMISCLGRGLLLFDTKSKIFKKSNIKSIRSNSPRRLYLDREEILWVAHRQKGVDFTTIRPSFLFKNPLPEQNINTWFIAEDKNGKIWVATDRDGIFVFSQKDELIANYDYNNLQGIKESLINDMAHDEDGNIWCISDHIVYKFEKGHWRQKLQTKANLFFLSFLKNGKLLLSTSLGIQELILDDNNIKLKDNHLPFKGEGMQYMRVFEDSKNYIYIQHKIDTLHIYKQQADKFIEQAAHSLKADFISFAEDSLRNCVWLGTSNGLFQLSNTDFKIKKVNLRKFWDTSPLSINGILAEKDALWLSTYRGLIQYDINTEATYHIREEEGLSDESFSLYAYHKASDGKMWLGNAKGLTVFDPKEQNLTRRTPNPYLDKVTVNNKAVDKTDWMQEEYLVKLSYKENTLEFNLLAVGTHLAKYNKVYYRLKNFDNRWVETTNTQVVRYAQLPPNDYVLEYFAVGANGIESKTKRAKFRISPPFWQTWWFRLLALFAILASTYLSIQAYVRAKTREEREKLKRQFAVQAERERIGSELHDDVASNLAVIKAISDTALPDSDSVKNDFLDISSYAQESYEGMKDIVWALNPENAPIVNLLGRVRKFTHDLFHAQQTEYILDIADDIPDLMLGSQVRKNVYLIVKEALHNVLKYAEAKEVTVEIKMKRESLFIAIKDDGLGFDKKDKKSGQGLRNMQKRAKEIEAAFSIDSIPDEGTSVTLLVTDFGYR